METESEDVPLSRLPNKATPSESEPAPFKWTKGDRVADIIKNNVDLTESDRAVMAAIVQAETDSLGACKAMEAISKADKDSYMAKVYVVQDRMMEMMNGQNAGKGELKITSQGTQMAQNDIMSWWLIDQDQDAMALAMSKLPCAERELIRERMAQMLDKLTLCFTAVSETPVDAAERTEGKDKTRRDTEDAEELPVPWKRCSQVEMSAEEKAARETLSARTLAKEADAKADRKWLREQCELQQRSRSDKGFRMLDVIDPTCAPTRPQLETEQPILRVFVEVHRPSEIHIEIVDYMHLMLQAAPEGKLTVMWDWGPRFTHKHTDNEPDLTMYKLREVWRLAVDMIDYQLGDEEVMGPINELIQSKAEMVVERVKMGQ